MTEKHGDRGSLRQCINAGLSLLAMIPLIAACRGENAPAADETEAVKTAADQTPPPVPPLDAIAPVGRSELLAAAAAAADEVAAGNPLPKANLEMTNRTFELRLPFACSDGISGAWGEWNVDTKTRVLRISIRRQLWGGDPVFEALGSGMIFDAAEGFWIERPWTRSEQCPPALPPGPVPTTAPPVNDQTVAAPTATLTRTLALVQYLSPDAPRNLRRGSRPYSYTAKLPEPEAASPKNFRVKLVGRISGYNDGQPVHCVVTASVSPPTCAAAVEFTQVVLEDADTGERLADWNS